MNHFIRNKFAYAGGISVLFIGMALRWYLVSFGFSVGTDYYSPEFASYWMPLLYSELVALGLVCVGFSMYYWMTRPLSPVLPAEELGMYWKLLGVFTVIGIWAGFIASTAVESDAAWHQVTIRDTDFTPTHIIIFYFALPALTAMLIPTFIWVHTRIPAFRGRVSIPFLAIVCGIIMIMPNYGFNEWGHTFFYAEELFAAPIHWGFVFLGWSLFFLVPLAFQIISRMTRLIALTGR